MISRATTSPICVLDLARFRSVDHLAEHEQVRDEEAIAIVETASPTPA